MNVTVLAIVILSVAGPDLQLTWHSMDGGGGTLEAAAWSIDGSVGQCDAGESVGGVWSLSGGFWPGVPVATCVGDVDGNALVDAADLALVLGAWGPAPRLSIEDIDANGVVNAADLALVLGVWGACE
ncbi:MAG: hypothetical protein SGJ11_16355 [Phycisphaerae bacterium]|nr:hypothetical protein [Phycisphaerae bacterium]